MSTLSITIIQADLHWEDKHANLQHFTEKINHAGKTELIILPEMFSTGFSMQPEKLAEKMDGPTVEWMKRTAAGKRVVVTGSVIIEDNGKFFNRLIWMLPNGQYGMYDKRHLFAFAGENLRYTAGSKRFIGSIKGWKINVQVCYDLRFPIWSRQNPRYSPDQQHEYDVLIYVANWPERRSLAWKTLLQARAIENQCYVIGVNRVGTDGNDIHYSGDSMIIDPLGEIIHTRNGEEEIFTMSLEKEKIEEVRSKYPFWKDADHFFIEP